MIDELGNEVTEERVQAIAEHIMFKSDSTSWEIGLVLKALMVEVSATRDELAVAVAQVEALRAAGDNMANCIEYFWKPSPCEHHGTECGACEVTRWGLLQESAEEWRELLAGQTAAPVAAAGGGAVARSVCRACNGVGTVVEREDS